MYFVASNAPYFLYPHLRVELLVSYLFLFALVHITYYWIRLLPGFTGIDQKYEEPINPDLVIQAGEQSIDECVQEVVKMLQRHVS